MLQLCCSTVLCMLLLVCVLVSAYEEDINITAGQNVILPCRAPNYNIIVADWSRADLGSEYVLLYRDGRFDPENQHLSFKNRVDLQDRQMKDGDVSLILSNVTINDTGAYECRVVNRRTNRGKRAVLKSNPISIITLSIVVPPGQTGGDTEDGGKEAGGKEDGGKEDGVNRGRPGLSVFAVICVVIAAFVISGKLKITNSSLPPPGRK